MTLIAVSSTTGIVSPGAAQEGRSGMTGVAIQSRCEVSRIGLVILANRCNTIMAGLAVINDAGMIEPRPDEATGCMTDATILIIGIGRYVLVSRAIASAYQRGYWKVWTQAVHPRLNQRFPSTSSDWPETTA